MQPSPFLTRILLGQLFLIALLPLVTYGQAASEQAQPVRRYSVEAGKSTSVTYNLKGSCQRPVTFSVKSKERFIHLERDSILIPPSGTTIHIEYDATGLTPGKYDGKVELRCRDCKKKKCTQLDYDWPIELTVTAPTAGHPDDAAARKAEQIETLIAEDLARVAATFEERVRQLAVIEGRSLDDGQKVKGYDGEQTLALIEDTKKQLLNALAREETSALQTYVNAHYPPANLKILRITTERADAADSFLTLLALGFRAIRASLEERGIVTIASANEAFKQVSAFLAFTQAKSGPITLTVSSEPNEANVELCAAVTCPKYTASTNSPIQRFFRGTYHIKVTKYGFLTIEQNQDIIGVGNMSLDCKLVPIGKSDKPLFCSIR